MNTEYKHLQVEQDKRGVVTITLNRPKVRNAFDDTTVIELTNAFGNIDKEARGVILRSADPVFCAGGDLRWMARAGLSDWDANVEDAQRLVTMFDTIRQTPVPVIGVVQGAAIGGGLGLLCACDIVIATEDAIFQTSETRLGLTPACIAPFVLARIGLSHTQFLFLSGAVISAHRAQEIGLVHEVAASAELNNAVEIIIGRILDANPDALRATKELLLKLSPSDETIGIETSKLLASFRASSAAQTSMSAFMKTHAELALGLLRENQSLYDTFAKCCGEPS